MQVFSSKLDDDSVVISVNGSLDLLFSDQFIQEFRIYKDQGFVNFILDLSDVSFIDSSGIAALIQARDYVVERGGDVRLIKPKDINVFRVFVITKLDTIFDFIDDSSSPLTVV